LRGGSLGAILRIVVVIVVGVPVMAPLIYLVIASFSDSSPGQALHWSLAPWMRALTNWPTFKSLLVSLLLTIRVPISLVIALGFAWFLVRVDIPGRRFITYALWFACFLPILPMTFGWTLLLDKSYGLANVLVEKLPWVHGPVFNINSIPGILWLHVTLTTVPIMTILLLPALRGVDANYEEASAMAGAGLLTTIRRISLPLLAPAVLVVLLAGFIRSLESFEAEQILGIPAGIFVYATRIYDLLENTPADYPQAVALSTLVLAVMFAVALAYQRAQLRYADTRTLGGKDVRVRGRPRGTLAWSAAAVLYLSVFLFIITPLAMLIAGSFNTLFGFFTIAHPWTLRHWTTVLGDAAFRNALNNSLIVSFAVAVIGTCVATAVGVLIARTRDRLSHYVAVAAWLPWAVPGLLMGTAYLTLFLEFPGLSGLLNTLLPLIVVLSVQALPLGSMMMRSALNQLSDDLTEAAYTCGAGATATYARIVLPLLSPMLTTVFVITFMAALRDISTTVLLAAPGKLTLSLLMFQYATSNQQESAAALGVIIAGISLVMTAVVLRIGAQFSIQ